MLPSLKDRLDFSGCAPGVRCKGRKIFMILKTFHDFFKLLRLYHSQLPAFAGIVNCGDCFVIRFFGFIRSL